MKQSIEKKLNNLLKLQIIDSNIYEIKKVRGALPEEVQPLPVIHECPNHLFYKL